eukprot:s2984_g11.t1
MHGPTEIQLYDVKDTYYSEASITNTFKCGRTIEDLVQSLIMGEVNLSDQILEVVQARYQGMVRNFATCNCNRLLWCLREYKKRMGLHELKAHEASDGKGGHGKDGDDMERTMVARIPRQGIITTWRGTYGWIEADKAVDHPEAGRNHGQIFLHIKDFQGEAVKAGIRVTRLCFR